MSYLGILLSTTMSVATVKGQTSTPIPVTVENFIRAESDLYFGAVVKRNGFGKFEFTRTPSLIEEQTVVRMNRDTLYGAAIFDLDAGPVTITLPDAGARYLALQIIDEDQYTYPVYHGAGSHTFSKQQFGTRYIMAALRILADPNDPQDIKKGNALQDGVKVQQDSPGKFEVPNWDQVSQKKVRAALIELSTTLPDSLRMFGTKEQVDPVRRLIGAAALWAATREGRDLPKLHAAQKRREDHSHLTVKDVPVDAFWSISLYNADGYFREERPRRLLAGHPHHKK